MTVQSAPESQAPAPSSRQPMISVIMPTFNRAHWLGEAVESLQAQETAGEFEYEIVVVNNASRDTTADVLADLAVNSRVPLQALFSEKPGDAPTRNAGVRAARGEWLAFFDDDQLAEPDWLLNLLRGAREANARIVGGPVLLDLSPKQLEALGAIGRAALREIQFYPTLRRYENKDLPGTGNALIHRDVFEQLGEFDESMTAGGSDTDLFLQARDAGYELWYAPDAAIRHRIEPNRLTRAYFRWDALSGGALHSAHYDFVHRGRAAVSALALARLGHAALVSLPCLAWGRLRRDEGQILGRQIQLWRCEGYLRGALRILMPQWFRQTEFFNQLDFRHGRHVGASDTDAASPADAVEHGAPAT